MPEHAPEGRDLNLVSLRDHVDRIFAEHEKALTAAFAAQNRAIEAALRNQEQSLAAARVHIENIFEEHRKAHGQKHSDDKEALEQARVAVDLRLEKLNELRAEVIQDRGEYVRRDVLESQLTATNNRLSSLENWRSKAVGAGTVIALISGAIGAAIARVFGG